MHKHTKLAPALREEIYKVWKAEKCSLRELGLRYHVDKRVIGRIIERGKLGDFSVHTSTNHRYQAVSASKATVRRTAPKKVFASNKRTAAKMSPLRRQKS